MWVRFLQGGPNNGDHSVKVNTTDCDSVNMGSIPIDYPIECPGGATGRRTSLKRRVLKVRVLPGVPILQIIT